MCVACLLGCINDFINHFSAERVQWKMPETLHQVQAAAQGAMLIHSSVQAQSTSQHSHSAPQPTFSVVSELALPAKVIPQCAGSLGAGEGHSGC